MANTSPLYARIDADLKKNAEGILAKLGISPSSAIQMLYSQIVLTKGIPFDLKLPASTPTAIGNMSRTELDAQLALGMESLNSGQSYSAEEVDAILAKEFDI